MNNEYYIERQKKWIDEVGLKVGDKVMLVGDPDPWRCANDWGRLHPNHLIQGDVSVVAEILDERIAVASKMESSNGSGNYFPFYVLLKINE
jgi:hypothetical protein